MKILILNYEFPPLGGGTGIANLEILRQFAKKKNLKIDLITSSAGKKKIETFSKNIRVVRFNVGKNNNNLHHQSVVNLLSYFLQSTVFSFKNRNNYDLVHAFSGLPGGITALLLNRPYIVSLRGTEVPDYEERFSSFINLVKPLIKLSWVRAKSIDANSKYLKRLALKMAPDLKIRVINNGVNLKKFYSAKKLSKKMIILCNSRLGKRKGVKYLIKAMPQVLRTIPKVKLWLVGEGIEKQNLKRLTSELKLDKQVEFLGRVKHIKLPEIYKKSSLFVLPSLSESLSNSLLEALACGLPVVTTKVGGNSELVSNSNGVLVSPAQVKTLAVEIINLLNQSDLRKQMSQASREIAKQYSWNKTAQKYFQLYSKTSC